MQNKDQDNFFTKTAEQVRLSNLLRRQNSRSLNIATGLLLSSLVGLFLLNAEENGKLPIHIGGSTPVKEATAPEDFAVFKNLRLGARSFIVWDIRNRRALYERNADELLPLASITKVMSAVTALDLMPKNSTVLINTDYLAMDGDSGLYAEESWRLKDLLDLSLVMSSNDGVSAIAAAAGNAVLGTEQSISGVPIFVRKMNEKAASIGLSNMRFINPTGLDEGADTGGVGSARDVAKLFEYVLKNYPEALEATRYQTIQVNSLNSIPHVAVNTNLDINRISGLIASKTGYTTNSGGNLAVIFDAGLNNPIVVVALGSTYEGRFSDVGKLVRATREFYADGDETNLANSEKSVMSAN